MLAKDETRYRVLIEQRLAELSRDESRGMAAQGVVTLDQQSVGRLSRMDAMQVQAMAKATAARRGQEVTRLRGALKRLEEGDYGYCLDCGDDIVQKRLDLDPAAIKCIGCASS